MVARTEEPGGVLSLGRREIARGSFRALARSLPVSTRLQLAATGIYGVPAGGNKKGLAGMGETAGFRPGLARYCLAILSSALAPTTNIAQTTKPSAPPRAKPITRPRVSTSRPHLPVRGSAGARVARLA
jgi:hypothetical protein